MNLRTTFPLLAFASLAVMICAPTHEYDIELRNDSPDTLDGCHVSFGGFRSVGGVIPPGVYKIHLGVHREMPDTVGVQFQKIDPATFRPLEPMRRVKVGVSKSLREQLRHGGPSSSRSPAAASRTPYVTVKEEL